MLEFKASSSQRFDLGLQTANGRFAKRIGPFAGVWVRAAIPLRYYRKPAGDGVDLAATFNQPRNSYWINIHSSGYGPTTNVTAITVAMNAPVGSPTLEIRSVTLATNDPGDAVLEGKPLIDEFGQYTHADWPGKARSLEDLKKAWAAEGTALKAAPTNRCPYGGFQNTAAKATGFFRVEQVEGRWWFVCPDGHLFYSTGLNGVGTAWGRASRAGRIYSPRCRRQVSLREAVAAGRRRARSTPGICNAASAMTGGRNGRSSPRNAWLPGVSTRCTTGACRVRNQPEPRVPYAVMLRGWQTRAGRSWACPTFTRKISRSGWTKPPPGNWPRSRTIPYVLGYFIGNEPPWPGRESQLCDAILAGEPGEIQKRLKVHLAEGDTPARRKDFVLAAFQEYVDTINAAVRRHDTNHLHLGIRFGGNPPEGVIKAARGFDVFSVNIYSYGPSPAKLDQLYALVQRPILIGEFHIGAPDRGLSPGLVQAMNQEERAAAYRYYVEQCAAHPAMVGTHWFQWLDQPATGRNDGENYNIGFIDVTDRPYEEMVAAARLTHDHLLDIHRGNRPPVARKARAQ